MGFLSKLFGGNKDAEKTALDLLKNLMNSDKKEDRKEEKKQELMSISRMQLMKK